MSWSTGFLVFSPGSTSLADELERHHECTSPRIGAGCGDPLVLALAVGSTSNGLYCFHVKHLFNNYCMDLVFLEIVSLKSLIFSRRYKTYLVLRQWVKRAIRKHAVKIHVFQKSELSLSIRKDREKAVVVSCNLLYNKYDT